MSFTLRINKIHAPLLVLFYVLITGCLFLAVRSNSVLDMGCWCGGDFEEHLKNYPQLTQKTYIRMRLLFFLGSLASFCAWQVLSFFTALRISVIDLKTKNSKRAILVSSALMVLIIAMFIVSVGMSGEMRELLSVAI